MNVGKYPLVGGMVQQLNNIDHISNNLANMNTNSYKTKHATQETFTDVLGSMSRKKIELNLENNTKDAADYINRSINLIPRQGKLYTSAEVGSTLETGNVYDFSISQTDTYFAVESEDGVRKVTRDGAFINVGGLLKTKTGEYVLDGKGARIEVGGEGWETTLGLYSKSVDELQTMGNNLYTNEEGIDGLFVNNDIVHQRTLETSNVNGISEMTELIESHRLLEQMQKSLQAFQEVDRISNDKIGNYKS